MLYPRKARYTRKLDAIGQSVHSGNILQAKAID